MYLCFRNESHQGTGCRLFCCRAEHSGDVRGTEIFADGWLLMRFVVQVTWVSWPLRTGAADDFIVNVQTRYALLFCAF